MELNAADAFTPGFYSGANVDVTTVSLTALSYRSVHLAFEREYDQACVRKNKKKPGEFGEFLDPDECIVSGGIEEVKELLSANGWHHDGSVGRVSRYYKDQEPVEISIEQERLEVRPLNREEAMENWSALRSSTAQKEDASVKADAFIESMKTE